MPNQGQCVQHVMDSLKYLQDQLFFNSTPQATFPSVGFHESFATCVISFYLSAARVF